MDQQDGHCSVTRRWRHRAPQTSGRCVAKPKPSRQRYIAAWELLHMQTISLTFLL